MLMSSESINASSVVICPKCPTTNINNNNSTTSNIHHNANTNTNSNSNTNSNINANVNVNPLANGNETHTYKLNKESPSKSFHTLVLEFLDVVISCAIIAPCVIAYWRGTWELMGVFIFPQNLPLSALGSFVIGGLGHLLFTLTQRFFKDHIHPDRRRLTYYVTSRCYTAIFGIVCVNMWRGAWILCDWLTSADSLIIVCVVTAIALLFLTATRTVRNLAAAPYAVAMDHKNDYFDVDTMFKIPGFHQPGLFVLDTLFSVFVIGTLVVIAWRGVWGIMDLTFCTHDRALSYWGSLIIGYTTVFVTFIIQPLIRFICKRIDGMFRLVICDIFYFLTFFGAVNAWRGIWNLLDIYLYPDNRLLSFWLTHIIPFLLLAALKCSNSILVRGVFIDAEGEEGECINVPINYVRLHFQRERNKKLYYKQNMHFHQQQHHNRHHLAASHMQKEKEAQITLIEKSNKPEVKIQSGMDATQIV